MTRGQLCKLIKRTMKDYRTDAIASVARNKHMNNLKGKVSVLTQDLVDALLVDFLNYFALRVGGMDYGMYTSDLLTEEKPQTPVEEMDEAIAGLVSCMPDEAHRELSLKWYNLRKKLK